LEIVDADNICSQNVDAETEGCNEDDLLLPWQLHRCQDWQWQNEDGDICNDIDWHRGQVQRDEGNTCSDWSEDFGYRYALKDIEKRQDETGDVDYSECDP
jgi:hypothetical protein